jgi:hypothetical protein
MSRKMAFQSRLEDWERRVESSQGILQHLFCTGQVPGGCEVPIAQMEDQEYRAPGTYSWRRKR